MTELIPITEVEHSNLRRVICYPKFSDSTFVSRLKELESLGVHSIELAGECEVEGFRVLGKGHRGVVVKILTSDNDKYALKILRTDSGISSLRHEAEMLVKANNVGVGAVLKGSSENFIMLELISGNPICRWLETIATIDRNLEVKKILSLIIRQCRILDETSIDHGELSRASKHILIAENNRPVLIDFGKASINRRTSNVTSICQYLFIGSELSGKTRKIVDLTDRDRLIAPLRKYKKNLDWENFLNILRLLGLD